MDSKIEKLVKWSKSKTPGPYRLEIHPTNRCNLRCKMCGTRTAWREEGKDIEEAMEENKKREMSQKRILDLIDESSDLGVDRILLTGGGEPFIRKDLTLRVMEKIKQEGIFGNINTNGTLLEKEDVERIIDMEWDLIIFSIDAPFARVHDKIRNIPETFEKAARNLIRFKKLKRDKKAQKPEVVFNTVLTSENYMYLSELVEFSKRVGCKDITLIPLIEPEKHRELSLEFSEDLEEELNSASRLARKYTININTEEVLNRFSSKDSSEAAEKTANSPERPKGNKLINTPCFEPFLNMAVKMDGEVTPCCMIDRGPENLKEKSLEEVWKGEYYKRLRENFRESVIPESCSNCILSKEIRNEDIKSKLREVL